MTVLFYLPLLLAFSSDAGATAAKPSSLGFPTACAVVTRADVEQALGRPVGRGKEDIGDDSSSCDYSAGSGIVTITVQHVRARLDVRAEVASLQRAIPGGHLREAHLAGTLAGTPAETTAFYLDLAGAGTQLHVIRGGHDYVLISVLGFGEADRVSQAAEKIARKALERF
ncbi:MAG: hypothetical protein ACLQVN_24680 [Bryobacteraceae bacterium]